ncbi:nitrogenase molybdenum-iron protein alpha chain [Propionispora hippei]|uniref:Nitrogenase protein alpha chain n=1 Tax=Propionispora hippei DSM 15287 TaxID=1123003 RepID=A0A1M6JUL4_9FIRM|nr:nitrogenase molybdenum-iron protein alpha chain [Propionispora hippei]SHJ50373.1 nitrogenase molybdenum-iron protein alpha chain [Propionispora hippei DSM 15287]
MAVTEKDLQELFEKMPSKVQKNRRKHILIKNGEIENPEIEANTRTIPGIITNRGCAYAGCKGVVLGPIKDMVHITHGPIGCAYYTWGTRRNKAKREDNIKNFINYSFSTDMQESDIVFGGEKKLTAMIDEVVEILQPKAITISATCPVGLIGDDINAVAREAQKRHGIQVLAFSCEGYKGVSQSAGHHIANNSFVEHVIGKGEQEEAPAKFSINLLGEYNIGGDGWEVERILKDIGYHVVSVMTGDGSWEQMRNAHVAELNLVQCHRSINYIAEKIETKYGTPWLKVNFVGIESTIKSLRDMALYFDDAELTARTEAVIAREVARVQPIIDQYAKLCQNKTAFCFVGGSRGHHFQGLFRELGIETILAGYEFAHRDDYEGRDIIPSIKPDADSKNIPDLHVEADPKRFRLKMSPEKLAELKQRIPLSDYPGMNVDMKEGHIIVDDLNHFETEEFIKLLKPDIFSSGIKDKYVVQKMGIPAKQLHSYDYSGPYAGFNGAVNFARDVSMGFASPTWNFITPPWKNSPALSGEMNEGGDK